MRLKLWEARVASDVPKEDVNLRSQVEIVALPRSADDGLVVKCGELSADYQASTGEPASLCPLMISHSELPVSAGQKFSCPEQVFES